MARFLRAVILMACLLCARSVFAGTYYVSADGSDSNNGTSKTTSWLHAPGMPNCTSTCNSTTLNPGDKIIFRGGDTWHFGNSSASPYTGGTWTWPFSGSSGNPIYIGVDQTWYTGGSWTRPILTGDNPLTPHPGTWADSVSSCPYQSGSKDIIFEGGGQDYFTLDNFEMLGLCMKLPSPGPWSDTYVNDGPSNGTLSNLYIHGWTHLPFSCTNVGGNPTGLCFGVFAFHGGGTVTLDFDVVDGSDSDPGGGAQFYVSPSVIKRSVFRYVATGSTNQCHIVQDTLWEYIYSPADGVAHGDTLLCIGEQSGVNAYYNFIMRHQYPNGVTQPIFWIGPTSVSTDYVFNDLIYDPVSGTGNYFNIQTGGSSGNNGTTYVFNNIFQGGGATSLLSCGFETLVHAINNYFITDASSPFYDPGTCITTTNLLQTNATANGQGYTAEGPFAYSPNSVGKSTVGAGTNERTALCGALTTAAALDPTLSDAASACQSDTRYACTYNTSNHTVSCPARTPVLRPTSGAWDIGAYQAGTQANAPYPPTSLTVSVQ